MSTGVSGILLNEYAPEAPLDRLREVAGGGKCLAQDLVAKATHSGPDVTAEKLDLLTGRGREIARLICRGLSNRTIAEQLRTFERTVGILPHDICRKLDIINRTMFRNL